MTTIWWLDALKRIEKIIRESAFEQKKEKPRLKFNPGLALIVLRTTGPCVNNQLVVSCQIRISNHKLMVETGRYNQTPHNNRFCPVCNSGIIEDEFHFLLHCPKYSIPREKFYNQIQHNFVNFNQLSCTELIIKLMNSQNFSVNSHLLKFVSLCNDLRNNLLSNHTDDTWLTIVIITLNYY